jgi:hypothetical protein
VIQPRCAHWLAGATSTVAGFAAVVLCVTATALAPHPALAQTPETDGREDDGRPTVRAARLEPLAGTIEIDGLLTEEAWADAPVAEDFRQREPDEGAPATERTEIRVLFDDRSLYVGVRALDREPERVIARILQRNRLMQEEFGRLQFAGDDGVALLFDPFHDQRNGVVFAANPNGAKYDALITDEGREVNSDWRGVWHVEATRTEEGWSAEFEIPFRTLRYPASADAGPWGFNVFRVIRRKNEETLWSAWSRDNEGFLRVSRAGNLEGLTDLPRPGLNLEVKPYVLSGITRELAETTNGNGGEGAVADGGAGTNGTEERDTNGRFDLGVDAKYQVLPGLVLDLTVNPDFAQVEVDDEQVNLTRFDLFFPEKRDFFLENAGIFEFGVEGFGEPPPYKLFFSRRIGIDDGSEVPVYGGVRLTGRVGAQTLGLLNVVTDDATNGSAVNHAILRYKRDWGTSGYIGGILTDLRREGASNATAGVDASYWPTATLNLLAFVATTATSGEGGDDQAYRLAADYTGDWLGFFVQHLFVGPGSNAELGFITRPDIRKSNLFLRLTPRPPIPGLRKIDFNLQGEHILNTDGRLQDWEIGPSVTPQWNSGEAISLRYERGFTRLDEAFELADRVNVPAGDYDTWEIGLSASTSGNRVVSLNASTSYERFFDGKLVSAGGSLSLAPGSHLSAEMGFRHDDVELPGGEFTSDIASLSLRYAFSTTLTVNALLQYNSLDRRISANVRLNLIHRPGSDLFIVLDEERGSDDSAWDFRSRGLVAKLTYLVRL